MRAMQNSSLGSSPGGDPINFGAVPGISTRANGELNGRKLGQEYDGLESGELAWILGRRHFTSTQDPTRSDSGMGGSERLLAMNASAHGMGLGHGVDRMQRLAYTAWIEGFFRASFGTESIDLHTLSMTDPDVLNLSKQLNEYAPFVAGCSVLGSVDLPHAINAAFTNAGGKQLYYTAALDRTRPVKVLRPDNTGAIDDAASGNPALVAAAGDGRFTKPEDAGLSSGIFVMEKGPFLRGKIIDDSAVDMASPTLTATNSNRQVFHTVARNLGDEMAFEALYSKMRALSMFDWTPDGMVLSKLESPSGDVLSSAELDARQAQLFNVAIQGPAIAKTWTGDPKMATMPMDKVFVCVVADVHTVLGTVREGTGSVDQKVLISKYKEWVDAKSAKDKAAKYSQLIDSINAKAKIATAAANSKYAKLVVALFKAHSDVQSATKATLEDATKTLLDTETAMQLHFAALATTGGALDFDTLAAEVKQGKKGIASSTMTNFRLMRCTSSYLAQTSGVLMKDAGGNKQTVDANSRCGLRLGQTAGKEEFCAEYIVGAWCIGTVLDNAASRSTVGHLVRIAPASMAININVNVEWWSGDKLYKNYMDVGNQVLQRGVLTTKAKNTVLSANDARAVGADVPVADLMEGLSFVNANPAN